MICRAARPKIGPYLDGQLSAAESRALSAHLDSCPTCRETLEEVRFAREALRRSADSSIPVPPDLCSRIKGALLVAEEERRIVESAQTPPVGSPAFIGTCASLFIGALMFYLVATQLIGRGPNSADEMPVNVLASRSDTTETATVAKVDAASFSFLNAAPVAETAPAPTIAALPATPEPAAVAAVSVAGAAMTATAGRRASPVRERPAPAQPPAAVSRRPVDKPSAAPTQPAPSVKAPCFTFADSSLDGPVEQAGRRTVATPTEPRSSAVSYASNLRRDAAALSPHVFEDHAGRRLLDPDAPITIGSNPSLASPALADPGEGLP